MKKAIIILSILLFPFLTEARSLSEVSFQVSFNMKRDCQNEASLGCFDPNIQKIFLSSKVRPGALMFVLTHEIGHYFLQDITLEEYQEVFGEGELKELQEIASNYFYEFIWLPFAVPDNVRVFLEKAISS